MKIKISEGVTSYESDDINKCVKFMSDAGLNQCPNGMYTGRSLMGQIKRSGAKYVAEFWDELEIYELKKMKQHWSRDD